MFNLELKVAPAYYDEYHQPCYPVCQAKGLAESTTFDLMAGALADGYDAADSAHLSSLLQAEVLKAGAGREFEMLEIGGGTGYFFDALEEELRTYINIEPGKISLAGNDLERLKNPKYQCIKCSAEELPLWDESVDVVLAYGTLDHIPDYRKALSEIHRVLRKGGFFIVQLNNRRSWWKALLSRTEYLRRREQEIAKEHYIQWSLPELKSHLAEFLTVINIYSTTFFPYVPKIWKVCLPLCNFIGRFLLPLRGGNTIAICQKSA